MRLLIVAILAFTLTGCAALGQTKSIGDTLLVLRLTWKVPAEHAGVKEEMQEHVDRLDAAIKSGNPVLVRSVLLSLAPIYQAVREQVALPTPEQAEFDHLALQLWDDINAGSIRREALFEAARVLLLLLT